MSEELQSLLEKIHRDGLEKAAAERDAMLEKARSEAADIIAAAKNEAEAVKQQAEADRAALENRAANAIKQAARDILLELDSELKRRVTAIVKKRLDDALSVEFMRELVMAMAKSSDPNADLSVMTSPAQCEKLTAELAGAVGADFVQRTTVFPNSAVGRGLKVSINNDQVFCDFSEAALTEMLSSFAGAKVSAILKSED